MRTLGIIAEYNPIHNGHIYQIEKAKLISKADFVVVVMSGDFTQRGEPAIIDKWKRAELACRAGADLVLEMPFLFATSSAE
ncbi:MAG: nucleotidyltransferase family protein, partial [Firmicutes bacterium]|nr:nucleotidyltransferase family protein [Bacillota bacterium]